jgi:cell division septum initiation protein DivIVA
MDLHEVAGKEFLVGLRGYVREDVRVYLRGVSDELFRREAVIADLRGKLEEAQGELAETNRRLDEANRRLEQANGRSELDRATLVKLVGEEASAILSAADRAAERIRGEAERQAQAVRHGVVSTRSQLAQLHQSVGRLLDDIGTIEIEAEAAGPEGSMQADVALFGPGNGSGAPNGIRLKDGAGPEADGESGWPWAL